MKNKKYSIVYSSLTGNTKVLADAIHEALPQDECEQCYRRRVSVSGQNATVCPGTLLENEGCSQSSGKS